jgi:uncharacterized membrane protein
MCIKIINDKIVLVSLFLIILLGSFLRIQNILHKEFWYDEAFTALMIDNNFVDILHLSKLDVHPPLYYLLLKVWSSVAGTSEFALRLPSVLFGLLLIPLAYMLAVHVTENKKAGLFSALIISVNPFLIIYSRETRSYSFLTFLTILILIFVFRVLKNKKNFDAVVLSLLLPMMFLTHYITIFGIPVFIAILLLNKKGVKILLPLIVTVIFWFTPTLMNLNKDTVGFDWIPQFSLIRIPQSIHTFILGSNINQHSLLPPSNPFPLNDTLVSIIVFICVAVLIGLSVPSKKEKLLIGSALIPIILVALTSKCLGKHLYVERFLIGYGTLLLVYCGVALSNLGKKGVLIACFYVLISMFEVLSYKPTNVGYKEFAKLIDYLNKTVVMADATQFITIKYYSNKVKLQEGNWDGWVVIKDTDIFKKSESIESFYLVDTGPLGDWKPALIQNGFYFYEWEN